LSILQTCPEASLIQLARACYTKTFPTMPKLKTHRGAAKRFKKTGSGKITRHHAFTRHLLTSKTRTRKRRLGKSVTVDKADHKGVAQMLPN